MSARTSLDKISQLHDHDIMSYKSISPITTADVKVLLKVLDSMEEKYIVVYPTTIILPS